MNRTQRRIVMAAAVLVALMCLIPPWRGSTYGEPGYSLVMAPHEGHGPLASSRLALQILAVVAAAVAAFVWARTPADQKTVSGPV